MVDAGAGLALAGAPVSASFFCCSLRQSGSSWPKILQNVHRGRLDFGASSSLLTVMGGGGWSGRPAELSPLALISSWSTLSTCRALSMRLSKSVISSLGISFRMLKCRRPYTMSISCASLAWCDISAMMALLVATKASVDSLGDCLEANRSWYSS